MELNQKYYIDTNVIIAIVEANQSLSLQQMAFIESVDQASVAACTSLLTLAECLVKPMADKNAGLISSYLSFLNGRINFPVHHIEKKTFIEAARWRAKLGCKLPDAIHLACAVQKECTVFLTNDLKLKLPKSLKLVTWQNFRP